MYALSVVLGVLAVAVTCTSLVVALTMVRSRDARIDRLQRHVSSLQDHYSHEVGKAECELWNLRGDYDTLRRAYDDMSAKAQAEADLDHDLLDHYQELFADSQEWAVDLKRQLEWTQAERDTHKAAAVYVSSALQDARAEVRALQHQLDALILGSTSRDDHEDGPCDCEPGSSRLCDSCDPWGVTL
jgi:chromosome segregation ATPase